MSFRFRFTKQIASKILFTVKPRCHLVQQASSVHWFRALHGAGSDPDSTISHGNVTQHPASSFEDKMVEDRETKDGDDDVRSDSPDEASPRVDDDTNNKPSNSGYVSTKTSNYTVNDYAQYEQQKNNRQTDEKRKLNQNTITKIHGDPEFAHVRKQIRKAGWGTDLGYILEKPENQSGCVYAKLLQKATDMKKFSYAKKLFDTMYSCPEKRENIDNVVFTRLFFALAEMKTPAYITHEYIQKMWDMNIVQNEHTLTSSMKCLRKSDTYENVLKYWKTVTEKYQVVPNIVAYSQLLALYVKWHKIEEGEYLWQQMVKIGAIYVPQATSPMLDLYASSGDTKKMLKFFEFIVSQRVPINIVFVNIMMKGFVRANQPQRAVDIFDLIEPQFSPRYGIKKNEHVILTLMTAYGALINNSRDFKEKMKYFERMKVVFAKEREKIGESRFSTEATLYVMQVLCMICQDPSEWEKYVVPEFQLALQTHPELRKYLAGTDHEGNIILDTRRLRCGAFGLYFLCNYFDSEVSLSQGEYIICIAGKHLVDGPLHIALVEDIQKHFPDVSVDWVRNGQVGIAKNKKILFQKQKIPA